MTNANKGGNYTLRDVLSEKGKGYPLFRLKGRDGTCNTRIAGGFEREGGGQHYAGEIMDNCWEGQYLRKREGKVVKREVFQ